MFSALSLFTFTCLLWTLHASEVLGLENKLEENIYLFLICKSEQIMIYREQSLYLLR